jgi:hypothetical protein
MNSQARLCAHVVHLAATVQLMPLPPRHIEHAFIFLDLRYLLSSIPFSYLLPNPIWILRARSVDHQVCTLLVSEEPKHLIDFWTNKFRGYDWRLDPNFRVNGLFSTGFPCTWLVSFVELSFLDIESLLSNPRLTVPVDKLLSDFGGVLGGVIGIRQIEL